MEITNDILRKYRLLYVEDNLEISEEVVFFLKPLVKELYVAYDGQEGLELYKEYKPDLIVTDIQMPIMNGMDMIKQIHKTDTHLPVIITTAFNEPGYLLEAINEQVDAYLLKPLEFKKLIQSIKKVVEVLELRRELITKNRQLEVINRDLNATVNKKTEEVQYLYTHDAATKLPNYVSLLQELASEQYTYIILLDISQFSLINKQYGKVIANKILHKAAQELLKHETSYFKLFKIESDHFVFLSKKRTAAEVEEFCRQIISFFDSKSITVEGLEININFAFGVSSIKERVFPLVDVEYALENAKLVGSRYYYFNEDITQELHESQERIKWLKITQKIVKDEMIVPYFEPMMDSKTKKIVKYEVLARGIYENQIVSPFNFIDNAEKLGIVTAITRIIINKSFEYFSSKDVEFSINLTQRDLLDKTFIIFVEEKLKKYNIKASNVTFEILENITMSFQRTLLMEHLRALKTLGFKIAIDDFGMDNSNFGRFMEMDFDYIKLDAVFIKHLDTNKKDRILVSTITALAHSLGMKTIAEYVANEEIAQEAINCGVDLLQGHYIGKAQPELKVSQC